jgi:hypothetical protein
MANNNNTNKEQERTELRPGMDWDKGKAML